NGYVLTKWRFRGHTLVFGLMLFACFIPFQSVLLPMATILGSLGRFGVTLRNATGFSFGLGNPTVNLVFVHVVYGLGFTTLFFRNYYEAFPTELV
ncbi:MAG: carbohydrate ABC transporter permease, partial [Mesorhizobium sp.]